MIRYKDYAISSDNYGYQIYKIKTNKDDKSDNYGKEYLGDATYHSTFVQALTSILKQEQRNIISSTEEMTLEQGIKALTDVTNKLLKDFNSLIVENVSFTLNDLKPFIVTEIKNQIEKNKPVGGHKIKIEEIAESKEKEPTDIL